MGHGRTLEPATGLFPSVRVSTFFCAKWNPGTEREGLLEDWRAFLAFLLRFHNQRQLDCWKENLSCSVVAFLFCQFKCCLKEGGWDTDLPCLCLPGLGAPASSAFLILCCHCRRGCEWAGGDRRSGGGKSVLSTETRVLSGSAVKRTGWRGLWPAPVLLSGVQCHLLGPFSAEDGPKGETVANKNTFAHFLQAFFWFFLQSKQRHGNVYRN